MWLLTGLWFKVIGHLIAVIWWKLERCVLEMDGVCACSNLQEGMLCKLITFKRQPLRNIQTLRHWRQRWKNCEYNIHRVQYMQNFSLHAHQDYRVPVLCMCLSEYLSEIPMNALLTCFEREVYQGYWHNSMIFFKSIVDSSPFNLADGSWEPTCKRTTKMLINTPILAKCSKWVLMDIACVLELDFCWTRCQRANRGWCLCCLSPPAYRWWGLVTINVTMTGGNPPASDWSSLSSSNRSLVSTCHRIATLQETRESGLHRCGQKNPGYRLFPSLLEKPEFGWGRGSMIE